LEKNFIRAKIEAESSEAAFYKASKVDWGQNLTLTFCPGIVVNVKSSLYWVLLTKKAAVPENKWYSCTLNVQLKGK